MGSRWKDRWSLKISLSGCDLISYCGTEHSRACACPYLTRHLCCLSVSLSLCLSVFLFLSLSLCLRPHVCSGKQTLRIGSSCSPTFKTRSSRSGWRRNGWQRRWQMTLWCCVSWKLLAACSRSSCPLGRRSTTATSRCAQQTGPSCGTRKIWLART